MFKEREQADQRLASIIARVENLNEEIEALSIDRKDVYAEAKADGFDVPTLKKVISLRKLDEDDRQAQEMLLDTYKMNLGMD